MGRAGIGPRQNALRSGLVVLGAVAFGYLSFQVGFKPFIERAQEAMERTQPTADSDAGGDAEGSHASISAPQQQGEQEDLRFR